MANSNLKIFESKTTVTINGLELDIQGEIYEKPIFVGSDVNTRILIIDVIGTQIIGTIMLPGKSDRQALERYMKDVIANPFNYTDKIL